MNTSQTCTDIAEFIKLIHRTGDVFEIRVPKCPDRLGGQWKSTAAGYFNDVDKAANAISKLERVSPAGIYLTVNPCTDALIARSNNCINFKSDIATSDHDIDSRRWLFIDIDPKRPAGVSATESELNAAIELASREHQVTTLG